VPALLLRVCKVCAIILPVPAVPPLALVMIGFSQLKVAPLTFEFIGIALAVPAQTVASVALTIGLGFTVTVMIFGVPLQVLAIGITL